MRWILCAPCVAGNVAAGERRLIVFANGQHRGIRLSTVEEDSNLLARFQQPAFADDLALWGGDHAVAAGENRRRIEVGEAGGQASKIGGLVVQGLVNSAAQSRRQRFESAGLARRSRAVQQQATRQAGQGRAGVRTGLQQASAEASLQVAQVLSLAGQVLRGMLESLRQPVQLLSALVELLLDLAAHGDLAGGETSAQHGQFGCRQLGGRGGRRRAPVGGEVGNREVGFMPDAADYRQRAGTDRPRHGLVVERPEVFDAAATASDDQHLAVAALAGTADGCGDLYGGGVALHRCRVKHDADLAGAPSERAQDIAQRRCLR